MTQNAVYEKIKSFLKESDLDGVLIARSDSFLGEYYPPYATRLQTVTGGFSGSAGLALITPTQDILFVDSRYTVQAKAQTDFQVYEVPSETTPSAFLKKEMAGKKIGFNPWTHSVTWFLKMSEILAESQVKLVGLDNRTVIDWFGDDDFVQTDVFSYDVQYAGLSADAKKQAIANRLKAQNLDALIMMSPENVSWLLNLRAKTVPEYPVVFQRGVVDTSGCYEPLTETGIQNLKGKRVALDLTQTPLAIYERLMNVCEIKNLPDMINEMKAVKNQTECENIRQACLSESKTICRFLAWVEEYKNQIDEMQCDDKLKCLRKEDPLYFADSFETIAGVGEHAARAHYRADVVSNLPLKSAPLLLVDTGGHYLNGTTDMTRTIAIGQPTDIMKKRYTQVLQGHIDLADSSIQAGQSTGELDDKAHAWLRADGVDYYHGTSHGIGMMLAVHEMPPVVHPKDTYGLQAGMVFSNEPAFYDEKEGYGIRLETMLMAVSDSDEMRFDETCSDETCSDNKRSDETKNQCGIAHNQKAKDEAERLVFENLLLIPFDYRLVDFSLLTVRQKQWLSAYHQRIEALILPQLSQKEQEILLPFVKAFQTIS